MAAKTKKPKKNGGLANLKKWKRGQSGNPKGRPPSVLSVTSTLKSMLEWKAPDRLVQQYKQLFPALPDKPTVIQLLSVRALMKALDVKTGDVMMKEIWERLDGKVPFPISGGGPDEPPIGLKFDFSGMSSKELDIFERLLGKCQKESQE